MAKTLYGIIQEQQDYLGLNRRTLNPNIMYYGEGAHTVKKRYMPDGSPTILPLGPSLRIAEHSPTGFSWGYGGSGPCQLALAILLDVTGDPETASLYCQDFKCEFVAHWKDGWCITADVVDEWLDKIKAEYAGMMKGRN